MDESISELRIKSTHRTGSFLPPSVQNISVPNFIPEAYLNNVLLDLGRNECFK